MVKVVVVGSINMDLVAQCPRFPAPGETLLGSHFATFPGGKGANQAVAASRLGAEVSMVGCVGDDGFGDELVAVLRREGVDTRHVRRAVGVASGVASITVSGGDNHIVVVPGANHALDVADVEAAEPAIAAADVVLTQLEVPLAVVHATAVVAHRHGVSLLLNPAPAQALPAELLELATLLTPNEHELALLLGAAAGHFPALLARLPGKVVMTHGADGAYHLDRDGVLHHQPGYAVDAVDTTGAGDTFNAALAVHWRLGLAEAMRHAAAAAALSVTRLGAQAGMPWRAELQRFMTNH